MPSLEGSNLRPLWRFRLTLNRQEVKRGTGLPKKMLIYDDRSRNVHENKQKNDKMPDEIPDIYVKVKRILQGITGFEGQFTANGARKLVIRQFSDLVICQLTQHHLCGE